MGRFEPRQYFDLARRLAVEADNPAALRSAVSRAYYGAYLAARPIAARFGIANSKHEEFWDELQCKLKQLADYGTGLRRLRNKADYDLEHAISAWDADFSVNRAEQMFAILDSQAKPEPVRPPGKLPLVRAGDRLRFPELSTERPMPGRPSKPDPNRT